ncbi:hypothetical protein [Azospirillum sp.]|uniref:hypothetical protein n=1 Tax=Azospirillum sp. TaxID=34012 RepID=UPI003D75D43A
MTTSIVKTDLPPPSTLASLLGRADYVRLSLTSDIDLEARTGPVDGQPTATLDDAWFVRMDERESRSAPWATFLHAVGFVDGFDEPVVTSPVERIDAARGVALTQSGSIYRLHGGLEARGGGEPPVDHLLALARALLAWGYGRACHLRVGWVEPMIAPRWGGWPRD